jgi:hypothetical protein
LNGHESPTPSDFEHEQQIHLLEEEVQHNDRASSSRHPGADLLEADRHGGGNVGRWVERLGFPRSHRTRT